MSPLKKNDNIAKTALPCTGKKVNMAKNAFLRTGTREEPPKAQGLATLRQIDKISGALGTHKFNTAHIDGWVVVVAAHRFSAGEHVLFFEPDAFIPAAHFKRAADLGSTLTEYQGVKGYRVTIRKVTSELHSEGFIAKLSEFPRIEQKAQELLATHTPSQSDKNSLDFTQDLGVLKWRIDNDMSLQKLGDIPVFVRDCSMPNGQNCPNFFVKPKYKAIEYQETSKMDGATMSCYFVRQDSSFWRSLAPLPACYDERMVHSNGRFGVCARNTERNNAHARQVDVYWEAALKLNMPETLARENRNLVVHGELVGDAISQNPHGFPAGERRFYVFWIDELDAKTRMGPRDVVRLAGKLGLEHVEVRRYVKLTDIAQSHADLLIWSNACNREGLVYKSCGYDGRWFKILSTEWAASKEKLIEENDKAQSKAFKLFNTRNQFPSPAKQNLEAWKAAMAAEREMWMRWQEVLATGDISRLFEATSYRPRSKSECIKLVRAQELRETVEVSETVTSAPQAASGDGADKNAAGHDLDRTQ